MKSVKHDDWMQSILTDIRDYHEAQKKRIVDSEYSWYAAAAVENHDEIEYGQRRVDKWKD
mgnify:FL=1|tara:strand:- start:291 stop:470 length:180 start_codon:yes stop_codon:yes gene_type:complete